jgi:long-chain acyl-CoA synthetase
VNKLIRQIGQGFISLGLDKSNRTNIGIYASAHVHYALVLYSCWPFSLVPVGMYDSLGLDAVRFIIRHADLKLIYADNIKRIQTLIDNQDDNCSLKYIVTTAQIDDHLLQSAENKGLRLITFDQLVTEGKEFPTELREPTSTDTALRS